VVSAVMSAKNSTRIQPWVLIYVPPSDDRLSIARNLESQARKNSLVV